MAQRWYQDVRVRPQLVAGAFAIAAAVIGGLFLLYSTRAGRNGPFAEPSVYRLRVIVMNPDGIPTDEAKVWSSVGGESKQVSGGWEFVVPLASRPVDGRITVFASREASFLAGTADCRLGKDLHPVVSVQLRKTSRSVVRGIVLDDSGRALGAVRVAVVGLASVVTTTSTSGQFVLPTEASLGEQVLIRAEKDRYHPVTQLHPAGTEPMTIVLERNR